MNKEQNQKPKTKSRKQKNKKKNKDKKQSFFEKIFLPFSYFIRWSHFFKCFTSRLVHDFSFKPGAQLRMSRRAKKKKKKKKIKKN